MKIITNNIRVWIRNIGNPLCKIFGHKWGNINKYRDDYDKIYYEQYCERYNCTAFRQGKKLDIMKTIDPNKFFNF